MKLRLLAFLVAAWLAAPALYAQTAGSVDPTFDPKVGRPGGDAIYATAVQPDGKTIIVGEFTSVGGEPRNRIARLNADGTLESTATFNPGTGANALVLCVAVQADGKILLGGAFSSVNGQPRGHVARLNPNGSLESTVTFNITMDSGGWVHSIAVQADGKILLGGDFTLVNGQLRSHIARLNADGTLESTATFNPGTGASNSVYSVAVQADGKIVIGGSFSAVNDQNRGRIARLNPDGSLETTATFNPGTGAGGPSVDSVAIQADGKIVIGGPFITVNGQTRNNIARLNSDGTLESTATFNPGTEVSGSVGIVSSAIQANGRIVIGGIFMSGNFIGLRLGRLNPDGTLESTATFDANPLLHVYSLAMQPDGKILLAGDFDTVNGQSHNLIARLFNDAATHTLTIPNGGRVEWLRGGTTPEAGQVTFELTTNSGATWSVLGAGARIAGGWERTGLSLPASGSIRARGRTAGGYRNGSSGIVEQSANFGTGTPFPQWKLALLGDAGAPNDGDPDLDGLRTILEYATGGNPLAPTALPTVSTISNRAALTFTRNATATDVTLTVQGSDDLATWTDLARSTGGAAMVALVGGVTVTEFADGALRTVQVRDLYLTSDPAHPQRFLRLHAAPTAAAPAPKPKAQPGRAPKSGRLKVKR